MIQRPNLQRNKCILHGFTRCPFLFVRDNSLSLEWRDECQELLAGSCVYPNWVVRAAVVRHVRRVKKFATAFVSELVDVLAVPGRCPSVSPHIRLSSSPASTPTARPSSPPRPALPNPCVHPRLPPSSLPATLVFSSGVPVLDQGSNIAPNQAKNITHVSKLCRFRFFPQPLFAFPFSPNFPLLASPPSIQ